MAIKITPIRAAILTLDSGERVHVERIGKGRYSTAWKNGTAVYVQTHEKDSGKELLCHLSGLPHLPAIEPIASAGDATVYNWYKMPLYSKLTVKHKTAWADYKHLKRLLHDATETIRKEQGYRDWQPSAANRLFLQLVEGTPGLAPRYAESIEALIDWCDNYGHTWLIEELQVRNCAVDSQGELILLDPVFDLAEVRADQDRRMKRARGY